MLYVSHPQPHLCILAVQTPWLLVHQFTLLLKMAAVQALVSFSLPHTFTAEQAYFTQAYHGPQLGLIISKEVKIEEDRH